MTEVIPKITSRGFWKVVIRPTEFLPERIAGLAECKDLVRELKVRFRGWDYPHYSTRYEPANGIDHVEQSVDWEDKIEFWRFYQSAQFYHLLAMWEDWQEQRAVLAPPLKVKPGEMLSLLGTVYKLTEIYEFAARLALKGLLGGRCSVSVSLIGTKGRLLAMLDASRDLDYEYRSNLDSIPREVTVSTQDLIAKSADLALDHIVWVFERFNWDRVPQGVLAEDQRRLIEKRL